MVIGVPVPAASQIATANADHDGGMLPLPQSSNGLVTVDPQLIQFSDGFST
jgi:hypothetical protein